VICRDVGRRALLMSRESSQKNGSCVCVRGLKLNTYEKRKGLKKGRKGRRNSNRVLKIIVLKCTSNANAKYAHGTCLLCNPHKAAQ
jgi:hypothetical protein